MADDVTNGAYQAMRQHLDRQMEAYEAGDRDARARGFQVVENLDHKSAFITSTAANEIKRSLREERREPDYDYAATRQAIADWSSEQTKAIATRQELAAVPWDVSDGKTTRVPASQLTKQEIVAEVRELHNHFKELESEYKATPAAQRSHLRQEMEPIVERERALRAEYVGRASQELSQDRVPDQIGYSR